MPAEEKREDNHEIIDGETRLSSADVLWTAAVLYLEAAFLCYAFNASGGVYDIVILIMIFLVGILLFSGLGLLILLFPFPFGEDVCNSDEQQ